MKSARCFGLAEEHVVVNENPGRRYQLVYDASLRGLAFSRDHVIDVHNTLMTPL